MFGNILAGALRNLARNRLYVAISVAGLALGLSAVILTALYVRDELSFDRFIPGPGQAYVVTSGLTMPNQSPIAMDYAPSKVAAWLKLQFPGLTVARLAYAQASVRQGAIEAREDVAWVDPGFFDILPLPTVAGDLRHAMASPDSVVVTRAVARKYFGRDDPVGQVLTFDRVHPLRVAAVIQDLPPETHLTQQIFASGQASFSVLSRLFQTRGTGFTSQIITPHPGQEPAFLTEYVRIRVYLRAPDSRTAGEVGDALGAYGPQHLRELRDLPPGSAVSFGLVPLTALHLQAFRGVNLGAGIPRGSPAVLQALAVIGALVLGLAVVNFVNLTTARSARRAVEVGVRKTSGAGQGQLVLQFLGEALIHVLAATVIAVAVVELALPALNALLLRRMSFPYWREPVVLAALFAGALVLTILAGAYPAFVLSSFRPAGVLKGGQVQAAGSGPVRQVLVVFQFTVLIGLIVAVAVIWRQTRYAMDEGLKLDKDQVLVVFTTPCRGAFEDEVRRLPGVRAAACSSQSMLGLDGFDPTKFVMDARTAGGPMVQTDLGLVDFGLFELYGVRPLAGRLLDRRHPGDSLPLQNFPVLQHGPIVINVAAARRLGFTDPAKALDSRVSVGPGYGDFTVAGVVPDFTLDLLNAEVKPTVYMVDFLNYPADQVMSIKLEGRRVPETLGAIDSLWKRTGQPGAIRRQFLDDYVQQIYLGTVRQGYLVTALSVAALFLACFGLLGLAAYTTERRTKEIGVRKAMGAGTMDVMRLLLWRFTLPVLWASLIAWPLSWWAMQRWLNGFAYRVDLPPWLFLASTAAALVIAWATVSTHAWLVARARPVTALRYE